MKIASKCQVRAAFNSLCRSGNTMLALMLGFASLALIGCGGSDGNIANPIFKKDERSATLSWNLPNLRADGSDLELYEIETFKIYHTTDDGAVEEVLEVPGDETELNLSGLKAGTHLFAVTVVDSNGLESNFSNTVTKSIL